MIFPARKRLRVLLFALTIFLDGIKDATCAGGVLAQREDDKEVEAQKPSSRTELITTFVKNRQYFNLDSKRIFFKKVQDIFPTPELLSEEGCEDVPSVTDLGSASFSFDDMYIINSNPTTSTEAEQQVATYQSECSAGALKSLLSESLFNTVCPPESILIEDPDPSEEAVKVAIEVAEKTIESLKEITTFVLTEINNAREQINLFRNEITELTGESLENYTRTVATATVLLNNAAIDARSIYIEMLELVRASLEILNEEMNKPDEEFVFAIADCQFLLSVAFEFSAGELKKLAEQVFSAQLELSVASDDSLRFAQVITDNINNKDGYLDSKIAEIRAIAYGACAVTCIAVFACPVCYGIAAGIVETDVANLKNDLENTKKVLTSIKEQFLRLGSSSRELEIIACNQRTDMVRVAAALTATAGLIKSDRVTIWKIAVLPKLDTLRVLLEKAIAAQDTTFSQLSSFEARRGALNGRRPPSDKYFPIIAIEEGESMSPGVHELLYSGEPDCKKLFQITPQPIYTPKPSGGRSCDCSSAQPGFVYGWSKKGDHNTKIGCAKGTLNNDCIKRIKQEINGNVLSEQDVEYECVQLGKEYTYQRFKYKNQGSFALKVCNAAEVLLQDYFYCQGKWLGRDGVGKPQGAKEDGKSEWFSVSLHEVKNAMRQFDMPN